MTQVTETTTSTKGAASSTYGLDFVKPSKMQSYTSLNCNNDQTDKNELKVPMTPVANTNASPVFVNNKTGQKMPQWRPGNP